MHRRRRVAGQKGIRVVVPHHPSVGGLDDAGLQCADESPVRVVEIGDLGLRRKCLVHAIEIATIESMSEETSQQMLGGCYPNSGLLCQQGGRSANVR